MKISVKDEKNKLVFLVPNWIAFGSLGLSLLKKTSAGIKHVDFSSLTSKNMSEIRRCIGHMKKIHKDWCLVDVYDPNDASVKIEL